MKHQKENSYCYRIDIMEEVVQEVTTTKTPSSSTDRVIINSGEHV